MSKIACKLQSPRSVGLGRDLLLTIGAVNQPWTDNKKAFLDRAYEEIQDGANVTAAMDRLSDGLWWYRFVCKTKWHDWIPHALAHPLFSLVQQDPFTKRSFTKPRGYAGDAKLLDLIYYDQGFADLANVSSIGKQVFWRNRNAPAPMAVRERRDHLAQLLDMTALRKVNGSALAVGSGHFREGTRCSAVLSNQLGRVVAFDQDVQSLSEIGKCFGNRVECVSGTIRSLLAGKDLFGGLRFDLIYAAGLYDYLEKKVATRLTSRLFELLAPDGQLVVANFAPDILDTGYMETYMGWKLIYRAPDELHDCASELPSCVRNEARMYFLKCADISYMYLCRN